MIGTQSDRVVYVSGDRKIEQRCLAEIVGDENVCGLYVAMAELLAPQEQDCPRYLIYYVTDLVPRDILKTLFKFSPRRPAHEQEEPALEWSPVIDLH